MKQSIILSFLAVFTFFSCRKEDNPKLPDLSRVPTPLILKDATTDQVISAQAPASFKGKFSVDVFYKTDVPPTKFDVVIIKNGDKSTVKTFKSDVTVFPTTLEISGADLATLFGAPAALGDKYEIGVDITTKSGEKFLAFPPIGAGHAASQASIPGMSTSVRYDAVCKYNPDIYQGTFLVVEDEWADYSVGDEVTVTKVDETSFSFKYLAIDAQPIIVKVNPITNAVTVAKQVYGKYGGSSAQYGNFSAESVANPDNAVAPCDQSFSVRLKHTVAAGSFGEATITLKKK